MCLVPPQCCFQETNFSDFLLQKQSGGKQHHLVSKQLFICFWVVQIFLLSEMRLSVRTHYGSSMGWIFISWNNTWQKVLSKGRKLSSELSLQITETEISPKMDKIAISTKKQVLSVRKLRPAHFQVFWWKYSKVTSANPSVLCFVSELRGREDCVLGKR